MDTFPDANASGDESPAATLTPAEAYACLLLRPDAGLACFWLHILLDDSDVEIKGVVLRPASIQIAYHLRLPSGRWGGAEVDVPLLELPEDALVSFKVGCAAPGTEPQAVVEGLRVGDVPFFRDWRATHHPHAHGRDR